MPTSVHPNHVSLSRGGAVDIATGYGLDSREVGVRAPVGERIFSSPWLPYRLWGPPSLLSKGYQGPFHGGNAAGAWSWLLTSNSRRGQQYMDLYIHSSIRLHGEVKHRDNFTLHFTVWGLKLKAWKLYNVVEGCQCFGGISCFHLTMLKSGGRYWY
jgi:hypothetical protein